MSHSSSYTTWRVFAPTHVFQPHVSFPDGNHYCSQVVVLVVVVVGVVVVGVVAVVVVAHPAITVRNYWVKIKTLGAANFLRISVSLARLELLSTTVLAKPKIATQPRCFEILIAFSIE